MKTLPITIIGGYLGAGKTTLLNRLLAESHGLRLAIVVNDFGSLNIDVSLVARNDGETIALTNGCICCGMADGFTQVLYRLREQAEALDGVVVETSGVADPAQTVAYATLPGFRPAAVIVLVDAERVRRLARDPFIGRSISRQLRAADVVLVTKGDLSGPAAAASVADWARAEAPQARVLVVRPGEAPIGLLFDTEPRGRELSSAVEPTHDHAAHESDIAAYDRATARPVVPVSEAGLRSWYAALPEDVLRVKGWVRLAERPDEPALVQGVGRRLTIERAAAAPEAAVLVLLGLPGSLRDVRAPDGSPLAIEG